jgi:hypothetical protein
MSAPWCKITIAGAAKAIEIPRRRYGQLADDGNTQIGRAVERLIIFAPPPGGGGGQPECSE